ncbi:MAG: hypothetical protein KKC30_07860 [Proteobacteria bacterium]|nr:hypothetical protein [Pseudomonadota bacterium]MBU4382237.1 hypothetical protein [Pseudomonadota bacterium]MCG2765903.1 hypothetical protein [Desulfarculaceae bacterium]
MSKRPTDVSGEYKTGDAVSFTQVEKDLIPNLRKGLNEAESTEDVKKVFDKASRALLQLTCGPELFIEQEELLLTGENEPYYQISPTLLAQKPFAEIWDNSDLPRILGKFASLASNRYRHLLKNPDKTEAKMHRSGRREGRPLG